VSAAESTAVKQLPVRTSPAPRRDYGWLAESLWDKVERMKRYPAMARMNRWEGKVVLKAVIKEDGSIVDLAIVESSGHAVLDEEALEVVNRASPLTLKHDLGQPQVTVQIPISYALR
jgi:protein TonB